MKRLWIGIGLLAVILVMGLWSASRLRDIHTGISEDLTNAAAAAQDGQWQQADKLARQAQQKWRDSWNFSAAMADHTVLDEIDGFFAQAEVYRKNRNGVDYAATCARLANAVEALQEGHRLTWWNLL